MTVNTFDESGSLGYGAFTFNIDSYKGYDHTTLPSVDFWSSRVAAYVAHGYGVIETDWGNSFQASEVPEPNSLVLIIGMMALLALRRAHNSPIGLASSS